MELLQQILVYLILALAVGYIVKKFFLPKSLFASKKGAQKPVDRRTVVVIDYCLSINLRLFQDQE